MGGHHARNYFEMHGVDLIAVCDTNIEKGQSLAEKYNCLFYNDYKIMLKEQKIDAVSIAVPTFLHYVITNEILGMGVSVLLEKPIATNLLDAKKLIQKAKKNNLKLMIGHIERFNPAVQEIKKLIDNKRFGQIISINTKRVGGLPPQIKNANVAIDLAIHDIDISNYLVGNYPKEVHGYKSKNLIHNKEDSAVILLKYLKLSSFIEVNWVTPVKVRTMDITGTKAFARLDYINQTITFYENKYLKKDNKYKSFNEFISKFNLSKEVQVNIIKKEPLRCELECFIDFVLNKKVSVIKNIDAYKALEIALKI